ncbi:MAG TPA: Fic family protein [Patescibacteria group bacterium]|nr:Fic family protein [Patescibacteria group bacterium]
MNYLSPQEVLYIHNQIIDELHGTHGVSNSLVLKKLMNYIRNNDIFRDKNAKAAALFFGISKRRPFIEKNIETAITATNIFLGINGSGFEIDTPTFRNFIKYELPHAKVEDIQKFITQNSFLTP